MSENAPTTDSARPETSTPAPNVTLDQGKEAFCAGDYENAVNIFGRVLKERVTEYGELAVECALPAYYYGVALLRVAQESKEIFAEGEEAAKQDPDDESQPSDLCLAWEQLECARHSFELDKDCIDHNRLADVHVSLGDVASETSHFQEAIAEYQKALSHLDALSTGVANNEVGIHRRYCEVYYKAFLASEFQEELEQAGEYCDKAVAAIHAEMDLATDEETRTELKEIENDLLERKEAIIIGIGERDRVKNILRQLFQKQTQTESASEPDAVNLGVVGRGKKRIQLSRIDEEDEAGNQSGENDHLTESATDGEASIKRIKREDTSEKETAD